MVKPIQYKIAVGYNETYHRESLVNGFEAFEMFGLSFGAHEELEPAHGTGGDFTAWIITELSTGFQISSDTPCFTMDQAIEAAKKRLTEIGEDAVREAIQKAVRKILTPKP